MPVPVMSTAILPSRALEMRICDLQCSDVCPVPWRNVQKLALCLYPPSQGREGSFLSFLPLSSLGQGLPNPPSLPPSGLAAQRILLFPELARNAKLAFSILHKLPRDHGYLPWGGTTASPGAASGFLGPWAKGMGRGLCIVWPSSPSLNSA